MYSAIPGCQCDCVRPVTVRVISLNNEVRVKNAVLSSVLIAVTLLAVVVIAEAQPKKVPRIGYLTASSAAEVSPRAEAFRQGLRDLGYLEGKNIVIEHRYAEGKVDPRTVLRGRGGAIPPRYSPRHGVSTLVGGGAMPTGA